MYTLEDDDETSSRYKRDQLRQKTSSLPPSSREPAPDALTEAGVSSPDAVTVNSVPSVADSLPATSASGNRKFALAALLVSCLAVFFTALDQTVVVTALPQIITDLRIPLTQLDHAAWIISGYLLGFVVAMPLMGRVSDIYGRRRIFLLCLFIFGAGSLLCALAPQLGVTFDLRFLSALHIDTSSPGLVWLIAARFFQAIGGGAVVPVAMAIAGDTFGKKRRALALGIVGAVTEAGGALGPLYGALVVQRWGWQFIFYLNIPLVVLLLILSCFLIPRGRRLQEHIDWLGALLLAFSLICLSLGLAQQGTSFSLLGSSGSAVSGNPLALILAAFFLLAFCMVELNVRWPVVDLTTFRRFSFSASSLVSLFVGAALIIALSDIPIYVDTVLQLSIVDSGLVLLRLTVMIPVGALFGGWLCDRITCRVTAIVGLLFTSAGFFLMSRWSLQVDWTQITLGTLIAGFGFGLVVSPVSTTAINSVRAAQAGMGSAVVTALRMVGMILGLAALTSWALSYFKQLAFSYPALSGAATMAQFTRWTHGYISYLLQSEHTVYTTVFFISMLLCLLAIIPACFLWGRQPLLEEQALLAADLFVTEPVETGVGLSTSTLPVSPASVPGSLPSRVRPGRRRLFMRIATLGLVILLIAAGVSTAFMYKNGNLSVVTTSTPTLQLALDKTALTSIFTAQLNLPQDTLSDLSVSPAPDDGLIIGLHLHIDVAGLHRVLPLELDGIVAVDQQHNLQITVTHVKRDGIDAGTAVATSMQAAINQLINSSITPALHNKLKGVTLISAHTSQTLGCNRGVEMFVLQVDAASLQGLGSQSSLSLFCFTGPIDLNKLLS